MSRFVGRLMNTFDTDASSCVSTSTTCRCVDGPASISIHTGDLGAWRVIVEGVGQETNLAEAVWSVVPGRAGPRIQLHKVLDRADRWLCSRRYCNLSPITPWSSAMHQVRVGALVLKLKKRPKALSQTLPRPVRRSYPAIHHPKSRRRPRRSGGKSISPSTKTSSNRSRIPSLWMYIVYRTWATAETSTIRPT